MCVNVNINKQGKLKNFSTCMIDISLKIKWKQIASKITIFNIRITVSCIL